MNGKKLLLGLAAVAVVAGAFTVLTGCEKDKSGTDLDRYFKENPYVADPRLSNSRKLEVEPETKAVTMIGEKVLFTVKGGSGSTYRWDVANSAYGTIARQSNTKQAIYTVKALTDNYVIVSDSEGSAGIATVQASYDLSIDPSYVKVANTNASEITNVDINFIVSGGAQPYGNWVVSNTAIGEMVDVTSHSPGTLRLKGDAGGYGKTTLTVIDSAGKKAVATVEVVNE